MITVLLIVHMLLAVALLGAITHQALSVSRRAPVAAQRNFVDRFRGVGAAHYTNAIVVLFAITLVFGGLLYPQYRLDVRTALEDMNMRAANGIFEIKEHLEAIGLGLLPAYWYFWQAARPATAEIATTRRVLTWILALVVWWGFLVGHILNNIKGFGS